MRRLAAMLGLLLFAVGSVAAAPRPAIIAGAYAPDGRPTIPCGVFDAQTACIVDTGSAVVIVPASLAAHASRVAEVDVLTVAGRTHGWYVWAPVTVGGDVSLVLALVVPGYDGAPILGMTWIRDNVAAMDFRRNGISLTLGE